MKSSQRGMLAAGLMLGMVLLAAIGSLQGALLNSVIEHFHLSSSAQGAASAAASAGSVLALLVSFLLIGRFPKLTLLRLALALSAVSLALLKIAPAFGAFVALWLLVGVGSGFIDMLLSSCMADLFTGREATRMMCLLHTCFGLFSVICPALYGRLLLGRLAWNDIYLCVAAAAVALTVFLTVAVRLTRESTGRALAAEERLSPRTMLGILRQGALPGLLAAMVCHGLFLGGLNTWINRYLGVTLASDLGSLGLSFLFFGVMASRLLASFLPVDTVRYVRVGGLAAGALLLLALPFRSGTLMCISLSAQGLAFGAMIPCLLDLSCREVPESTMLATTAMGLSLYVGQIIAPPLIGALESAWSLHAGIALCGVFMLLASACCIPAPLGRKKAL